jgi:hypothetical protein
MGDGLCCSSWLALPKPLATYPAAASSKIDEAEALVETEEERGEGTKSNFKRLAILT